jgi:hypothetical protein
MKLTQISVFLENKEGRLNDICKLLGDAGIDIRALNIAETSDYGILRMVVDKPQRALETLRDQGLVANLTDIVAVVVEDRPGGLAHVLDVLQQGGVNVEYMYGFFEKRTDGAILVFRFDDPDAALALLESKGVRVATSTDLDR